MRMKGKITHWNEAKGFGFITPASGAKQVFVDLSAFSDSYLHPRVGLLVTFNLSTDKSGRSRAEDVVGADEPAPRIARRPRFRPGAPPRVFVLLAILLIAAVAYSRFN